MGKKMLKQLRQYPNLVFTGETLEAFSDRTLSSDGKNKLLRDLALLDSYGTDKDYFGKRLENIGRRKFWMLRIKDASHNEWRLLFRRVDHPDYPNAKYAMIYMFRKTTPQVNERDFDTAERIAKRVGL